MRQSLTAAKAVSVSVRLSHRPRTSSLNLVQTDRQGRLRLQLQLPDKFLPFVSARRERARSLAPPPAPQPLLSSLSSTT